MGLVMRYLVLICISLGIVGCGQVIRGIQESLNEIDNEADRDKWHQLNCVTRRWFINCLQEGHTPAKIRVCQNVFKRGHNELHEEHVLDALEPNKPLHYSNDTLLSAIRSSDETCGMLAKTWYDHKMCYIEFETYISKMEGC